MKKVLPFKILAPVAIAGGCRETRASDDRAVALACALRDEIGAGEVVAAGIGRAAEEGVLAALARGADRAILIETERSDRQAARAGLLALYAKEKPRLVVVGPDPPEIGPYVAGALNIPQIIGAVDIDLSEAADTITAVCELERRRQRLQATLPALVVVSDALPSPPLLSLYTIVDARKKPLERVSAAKITRLPPNFEVLSEMPTERRRPGKIVGSVDELIEALRCEAHVI